MTRPRIIQYGVDQDTGLVVSRVGSEVAWPILDYEGMTAANGYATRYNLERFLVRYIAGSALAAIRWTRKVPVAVKNRHREFWGMKPLSEVPA